MIPKQDLYKSIGQLDERRQQAQGEEEVPMNAILGDMFSVVKTFDADEANNTENEERNRVPDSLK